MYTNIEDLRKTLGKKREFVSKLNDIFAEYFGNIDFIKYEAYYSIEADGIDYYEFVIVHYKGGCVSPISVDGDSEYGILCDLTPYIASHTDKAKDLYSRYKEKYQRLEM